MKNLLIIGARGTGRELYGFREDFIGYGKTFIIKGFLDDDKTLLDNFPGYPPILSSVEEYKIQPDDVFVCALGIPQMKRKYIRMIEEKGGEFFSLISKSCIISNTNRKLGKGVIALCHTGIDADTEIGDFVTILAGGLIGHDSVIENYCTLDCHVFCGGGSHIKQEALLSTGVKVMPHKTVGENAIVNAGSVVARDIPAGTTVMGIPAQESRSWLKMILQWKKNNVQ